MAKAVLASKDFWTPSNHFVAASFFLVCDSSSMICCLTSAKGCVVAAVTGPSALMMWQPNCDLTGGSVMSPVFFRAKAALRKSASQFSSLVIVYSPPVSLEPGSAEYCLTSAFQSPGLASTSVRTSSALTQSAAVAFPFGGTSSRMWATLRDSAVVYFVALSLSYCFCACSSVTLTSLVMLS